MRVAVCVAFCLVSTELPAAQQPAAPLSLEAALDRALTANRSIAAARLQRPIDVAGVAIARERPNPEVTYEAERETPRQAIGATLPLELGGKRQRRIELAEATMAVGEADLDRVIAEIRSDVRRAYFDVVAADERVAIAENLRALAVRARDAAQARYDAGDVPRSDLLQAQLALANADNELTGARGEADATRAELNVLLGQPPDAGLALSDNLAVGALPSLADAVARASRSNTALAVLDRRLAEERVRRALARALQTPDVAAGGSLTYDAVPEFHYGWRLSFGVTVPVMTRHRAAVLQQDATISRLGAERDAAAAAVAGAIAASLARASAAHDQLTNYQSDILPRALETERLAEEAYRAGQTNLVGLLEALRIARETRQRGLQAGLDFQHALADLDRAIGAR